MKNLILIGYKSSGKTYFGRLLAKSLNVNFVDTDWLVEELYEKIYGEKKDCKQISIKLGEEGFRRLEEIVVRNLKNTSGAIISLGGGTVLSEKNCHLVKALGTLIYLETDKVTIKKRMFTNGHPSFLDPKNPDESFEKMFINRKSIYENIACYKLQTLRKSEEKILEELREYYS